MISIDIAEYTHRKLPVPIGRKGEGLVREVVIDLLNECQENFGSGSWQIVFQRDREEMPYLVKHAFERDGKAIWRIDKIDTNYPNEEAVNPKGHLGILEFRYIKPAEEEQGNELSDEDRLSLETVFKQAWITITEPSFDSYSEDAPDAYNDLVEKVSDLSTKAQIANEEAQAAKETVLTQMQEAWNASNEAVLQANNAYTYANQARASSSAAAQSALDARSSNISAYDHALRAEAALATLMEREEDFANVQSDWEQTDPTADDYIKNIPGNLSKVYRNTTSNWNAWTELVTEANAIYIYTDYRIDQDNNGTTISTPGIKIGDGLTRLIDLPFVDGTDTAVVDHMANNTIHITAAERQSWNGKMRAYVDPEHPKVLVLTTN